MKAIGLAALLAVVACGQGHAGGPEGHSIVAEIAQRRLSPQAAAAVDSVLGRGHSLASAATWADDVREARKSTTRWHFGDMPIASDRYDPATQCEASPEGDCVIAELERLRNDLRCAPDPAAKQEALKFAVHYLGDIHQPLHTVADERGGAAARNRGRNAARLGAGNALRRADRLESVAGEPRARRRLLPEGAAGARPAARCRRPPARTLSQ